MTKEEYIRKKNEDCEWSPGWDAIEAEFERIYPAVKPAHYATGIQSRAICGGDEFLDGFSAYDSGKGYQHIVTFGMSELYADEEAFGEEYSKWGYEMTIKLKADNAEDCIWAMDMLSNLARYTFRTKNYYDPEECVPGNGTPLHIGTDSKITALITVADTSADTLDTVNGKVGFVQFVGITESELNAIKEDIGNIQVLIELMRKDNPEFITDMNRDFSYL
ncbi:MAG: suppressor of fused domain protein [Ruminococcus flavefaciens]|nr:suppressor of fused domain protein [Ruminococcus flavefaciens]MCM1229087.1 suppressor of fused domain protein [Ruminococcus flavefaciens]